MMCQSHDEIKSEIADIRKQLTVTVTNGKTMQKPLNEAVAEIWEHTVFLRDLNKVHWTFKKWKAYKIMGIVILIIILIHLGINLKEIILKLLT